VTVRSATIALLVALGAAVALLGCSPADESSGGIDTARISDASRERLQEALGDTDLDDLPRRPMRGPRAAQGAIGAIGIASADATEHLVELRACTDEECVAGASAAAAADAGNVLNRSQIALALIAQEGNACQRRVMDRHEEWLSTVRELDEIPGDSAERARARASALLEDDARNVGGALECL
jgi:hypothetical protein